MVNGSEHLCKLVGAPMDIADGIMQTPSGNLGLRWAALILQLAIGWSTFTINLP